MTNLMKTENKDIIFITNREKTTGNLIKNQIKNEIFAKSLGKIEICKLKWKQVKEIKKQKQFNYIF